MKNLKFIFLAAFIAIIGIAGFTKAQIGGGISSPILWIIDGSGDLTPSIASQSISVYDIEVTNAFTLSGTVGTGGIDMNTEIITNIGNAGTDFVASTGALNLAGDLSMLDDKKLYLDTAKTEFLDYSTNHGGLYYSGSYASMPGDFDLYSNTGADGSGTWQPYLAFSPSGKAEIVNHSQGNIGDRYLEIEFTDGMRLTTNNSTKSAIIKSDNITQLDTNKTFQFPNASGTFITSGNLTDITTVGTIGAGTWNGTDIAVADGGTGKSSWTQWLIPYADTTTSFSQIAIGTSDQVLTSNGAGAAPTFQDAAGGGAGGVYGINVETLTGDKTLTANTNKIYQYIDEGGANRTITIATTDAIAGDRFIIRHNGEYNDSHYLEVKQGATSLDKIYAGDIKEFIFNGTNWISGDNGTGENTSNKFDTAIGYAAKSYNYGTAFGYSANGSDGSSFGLNSNGNDNGAAFGRDANGSGAGAAFGRSSAATTYGVAVGYSATGSNYGIALGSNANTNGKHFSMAWGKWSETERYSEMAHNISGSDTDQENNLFTIGLEKETANNTPIEMLAGGVAAQRLTVRASSTMTFTGLISARDNVAGHGAAYKIEGAIKRDAAGNTAVLAAVTITAIHEDDASWDVTVAADDTNEALVITVTGDATNPTQWAARVDGVETHF